MEREYCLAKPPNFDVASNYSHLATDNGLDICLPQLLKRQAPGESVQLATASETALVYYPTHSLEPAADNSIQ